MHQTRNFIKSNEALYRSSCALFGSPYKHISSRANAQMTHIQMQNWRNVLVMCLTYRTVIKHVVLDLFYVCSIHAPFKL